jgi:tRNA (guanosine-2'-O-)-methyltransferase
VAGPGELSGAPRPLRRPSGATQRAHAPQPAPAPQAAAQAGRLGPAEVIARLEPLLTEARRERLRAVLASRSDHVAFVFERMIDPHNLSAALRSLDAFSFQDAWLVAPGERLREAGGVPAGAAADADAPPLARGITIGAERWLSLHEAPDSAACLRGLKRAGYTVYASHLGSGAATHLEALELGRRTALVFGNEHLGVSDEVLDAADGAFRIETLGFAQSLNLSVAVAISAYVARQAIARLAAADPRPERFALAPERQQALYAAWLRGSVKHAARILGEEPAPPEPAHDAGADAADTPAGGRAGQRRS